MWLILSGGQRTKAASLSPTSSKKRYFFYSDFKYSFFLWFSTVVILSEAMGLLTTKCADSNNQILKVQFKETISAYMEFIPWSLLLSYIRIHQHTADSIQRQHLFIPIPSTCSARWSPKHQEHTQGSAAAENVWYHHISDRQPAFLKLITFPLMLNLPLMHLTNKESPLHRKRSN